MNVQDASGKDGEGEEEHVIENWRRGDACYVAAESLAAFSSIIMWKAGLVSEELGYLAQISKHSFEGVAWFLLLSIAKCEEKEIY